MCRPTAVCLYSCFEVNIKDGIAHLSMNRPDQLNSMTRIFWKELPEIIKNIDKNSDARVIVLSGQGKHFSAGMDLGTFIPPKKSEREIDPARQREAFYHEVLELQDTFTALEECRMTDGQRLKAPLIVSNADAGHTYDHLLRKHNRRRWTPQKLARKRWSMGLFVWYFGTRGTAGRWADVGHHTIANGPRYKGLLQDIFLKGRLSDDMSLYIHRPSVTDPSVAPEGDDTFYVLSPVPHLGWKNKVDWQKEMPVYRAKVAAEVEKLLQGFETWICCHLVE